MGEGIIQAYEQGLGLTTAGGADNETKPVLLTKE